MFSSTSSSSSSSSSFYRTQANRVAHERKKRLATTANQSKTSSPVYPKPIGFVGSSKRTGTRRNSTSSSSSTSSAADDETRKELDDRAKDASIEERKKIMKRVLSGVQPTGAIHLGNYFGAIQNYVKLQNEYEAFYCVVDLHAITAGNHDPMELERATKASAAIYLASGVNPDKASVFVQSHVAAHSELCWLLNCVSPIGWLEKMIQFKEKARKAGEEVSVGLLDYPVLMAADILLYNADLVPVGEDQRQHLELTRDIAGRFNNMYGGNKWKKRGKNEKSPSGKFRGKDVLIVPEAFTPKAGGRVMSLTDGSSKMSKSNPAEGSRINVLDSPDIIVQKIKRCKTDAIEGMSYADDRPEAKNLLTIYELCSGKTPEEVLKDCESMRWGEFKPALTEVVINHLKPIQEKYNDIISEQGYLDDVLEKGAVKANEVAEKTVADVRDAMGFVHRKSRYL